MANPGAIADISVNITGDYSDLNDSVTSAVSAAQEGALTLHAGDAGLVWFNTTDGQFKGWNGSSIIILG